VYKPAETNKVVDVLSRSFKEEEGKGVEINEISRPYWQDIEKIEDEIQNDTKLLN